MLGLIQPDASHQKRLLQLLMQKKGEIDEKIMYKTFNMGIGMDVAVAEEDVRTTMAAMKAAGDIPYIIGSIEAGEKGVTLC